MTNGKIVASLRGLAVGSVCGKVIFNFGVCFSCGRGTSDSFGALGHEVAAGKTGKQGFNDDSSVI